MGTLGHMFYRLSIKYFFTGALALTTLGAGLTAHGANLKADPGATFSGNYLAGRHAQTNHDTLNAALFLGAAAQMVPDNVELLRRAYVLALSEGNIAGGIKFLERIEKLGGDAPLSDVVRATQLIKSGQYAGVAKYFKTDGEKLVGINAYVGPILSAWALAGEKKFDQAISALEKDKDNTGSLAFSELHLGLINEMGGNIQAAEQNFNVALKESGVSLRLAQHLGGLLERANKPDQAMEIYAKYDAIDEGYALSTIAGKRIKSASKPKPEINTPADGAAEAMFGLASSLSNQGALESAMVLSQLALYLRPNFPAAIIVVGGILESYQRFDEASAIYAKIPKTSVTAEQAKLKTAANLERTKQVDAAIKMLQEIASVNKSNSIALVDLGDTLRRAEKFAEAAAAYSEAISRIKNIENHHWGIFYSRGISFERSGKWQKAEDDFLTALKMDPEQPFVLNYLGYSWIEKKINLKKAVAMIEKAVELRPRDGYIVDSLGWGLYQLGDFVNAVKKLERAVLLRPEDPIINDHLGDALWQIGRLREARFQWDRALGLDPEPEAAAKITEKLKSGLTAVAQ